MLAKSTPPPPLAVMDGEVRRLSCGSGWLGIALLLCIGRLLLYVRCLLLCVRLLLLCVRCLLLLYVYTIVVVERKPVCRLELQVAGFEAEQQQWRKLGRSAAGDAEHRSACW